MGQVRGGAKASEGNLSQPDEGWCQTTCLHTLTDANQMRWWCQLVCTHLLSFTFLVVWHLHLNRKNKDKNNRKPESRNATEDGKDKAKKNEARKGEMRTHQTRPGHLPRLRVPVCAPWWHGSAGCSPPQRAPHTAAPVCQARLEPSRWPAGGARGVKRRRGRKKRGGGGVRQRAPKQSVSACRAAMRRVLRTARTASMWLHFYGDHTIRHPPHRD